MSKFRSDLELGEPQRQSRCSRGLHVTWKVITCLFSHVTLVSMVICYCIFGAFTFEKLEADNERMVKQGIIKIRTNTTDHLWKLTAGSRYLHAANWTADAKKFIKDFETGILFAMTKDGWDGNEDSGTIQWTFAGALFYSIIVITTIGYGHIAPKTQWGKVVTIFYAILGIPLMLLTLSNIGDVLASSFRFLYWRVCCYVCTKKPKKKRVRSIRSGTVRYHQGSRYGRGGRNASFRKSARISQRSADSGFGVSDIAPSSYSDTECSFRNHDERHTRCSSLPRMRSPRYAAEGAVPAPVVPTNTRSTGRSVQQGGGGGSLDRRRPPPVLDPELAARTPILCNKYIIDAPELNHIARNLDYNQRPRRLSTPAMRGRRAISVPRQQHFLEPPPPRTPPSPDSELQDLENTDGVIAAAPKDSRKRNSPSPYLSSPTTTMSPMGFGRQRYAEDPDSDLEPYEESYYSDSGRPRNRPVPIWLCVFLVVSYIFGGAFLFVKWEEWSYLDSAYFCFITLTTIGFGDFVPAKRVKTNAEVNIALCSLYLLFGISLLAMSFNLVQEEVIANVKSVAKTLGIIKSEEESEDED